MTSKLILLLLLNTAPTEDQQNINFNEAYCLAQAIYFEARNEDTNGQIAVAYATLNRVKDPRFPKTVCSVVKQASYSSKGQKLQCAFSWYCTTSAGNVPVRNKKGELNAVIAQQFKASCLIAIAVLAGKTEDNTNGATHFHNPSISRPSWSKTMIKTARIGHHDFYRNRTLLSLLTTQTTIAL